ncbi:MAG: tRNA (guanosine(46)-N7)-methyltransferase TrmB, partial [Muribaculaceae bacterium]|nr:tRNA (guanosine(46)-N7)-methyltransferase TrmB [Muribaculaceae bacterium]
MGKNKLQKFSDMETFGCVLQYPRHILIEKGFPYKGKWNSDFFSRSNPITLELGCGKGEYTVGLAEANHDRNYVGVDIKGARMWKGAKSVEEKGMDNAAFLRTEIEQIEQFFAPGEVDEIWITFPDPQMQKARKRLTSSRFLTNYRKFLRPGGVVNLKTDSPFLYEYT